MSTVHLNYEIERYLVNNKYVLAGEEEQYKLISLDITGSGYYTEGKYSGAPENCYPSESDVEIDSAMDSDGKDWINELTPSETTAIEEQLMEKLVDDSLCDDDDYYEDD
jgi:hypothetical protein